MVGVVSFVGSPVINSHANPRLFLDAMSSCNLSGGDLILQRNLISKKHVPRLSSLDLSSSFLDCSSIKALSGAKNFKKQRKNKSTLIANELAGQYVLKKTMVIKRLQDMIALIVAVVGCFLGYAYLSLRAPPPKICGSPGGPLVTSPRIKLSDGRHLAYKERGVPKEEAKYKVVVTHGFDDSKDFHLAVSEELLKELQIYILSFDRAGYGESDPNPGRSVRSEAFDIRELVDGLQLGPKFYLIGISIGAYPVYSCLKYIPHRLSGAALVVPFVNYWWRCFPAPLSKEALGRMLVQDQWTFRIAHYAPSLVYWWMTQKWFPSMSIMEGKMDVFSRSDLEVIKQLSEAPMEGQEKVRQQGVYECLHRDMMVAFAKWDFDPTDITNPFPNKEGSIHMWQGYEDKIIPLTLNRYLSEKLPWIHYHEVPDAGHLMIYNSTHCEAIIKALVST